jgi:hypothetical protein
MQRLDVTVGPPPVAQRPPHRGEGALQRRVADELPLPDLLAQLLLGDDALAVAEQIDQHLEDFRPQSDGLAGALEDIPLGIQDTVAEGLAQDRIPRAGPAHRHRTGGHKSP